MNQTLDSTVEALTFNFASYGVLTVVNNPWTWVAVIMAAVSFWRMRATCGAAATLSRYEKSDQKPSTSITGRPEEKNPTLSASVGETSRVWPFVYNDGGMTKGEKFKWTVYYEDDDRETHDGDMVMTVAEWSNGDGGREEGSGGGGEWWERVLKVRKGEMVCYGYQDLTVLNGNVVRLWDGSCRRGW
ncbi:hypothetical protein V6N13_139577 [Hibiscus sabdariffa]|uniref:Transmembrane protein n=1 Tax=Hibiscus sabdariffa TaxID=183260 RepID=A0ABR2C7S1_9ROSI